MIKSILAGLMISIGGTVYLSIENKIIGAILFSIGLFTILTNNFNLFTGKIGYLVSNCTSEYIKELFITICGNFIGTYISAKMIRETRIANTLVSSAKTISTTKLQDSYLSIFILSIFCGILMFLAVSGFKTIEDNLGKYLCIFLYVPVFILCSFEHCIANMFYFSLANIWNLTTCFYLILMILGNSIGGILLPLLNRYFLNFD